MPLLRGAIQTTRVWNKFEDNCLCMNATSKLFFFSQLKVKGAIRSERLDVTAGVLLAMIFLLADCKCGVSAGSLLTG